ncbi:hypothetical protein DYQ86_05175 [Acidobacteria bacterium AB60]|nr:hypothetical protein DYQ86_05175 [Acidobacteria bacterium AB60]
MATELKTRSVRDRYTLHGLSLPRSVLNALLKRGIHCQPAVSLEHQHLAKRYVLRGVESGGAVSDIGRACTFVAPDGNPLVWLQRIDSIAVNGRHAIFLAEALVRLEMLRVGRTCELVVTLHTLSCLPGRTRPDTQSKLIFHGHDGILPLDLWKQDQKALRGSVAPVFFSRAGETVILPKPFEGAIKGITACVCCVGCKHSHLGVAAGSSTTGGKG